MRYGETLPAGFNVPRSAFWLQKDLTKTNPFELLRINSGDVVMDFGAYIGTFTAAAIEQGAASVTCYEAAPKNASLLRENMLRYGGSVSVVEAAVTAADAESVPLTMSGFSGANSILPSAHRPKAITVRAVNFRRELLRLRPQVLKLDVEGAEYSLMASLAPHDLASVTALFIEFHPIENRDEKIREICHYITNEGLSVTSARRRAFVATRFTEEC